MERHTIPARKGLALRVSKAQHYKVLNTHGTQIVDHWAFNAADIKEFIRYLVYRAEMDAIVVFSACPQEMVPVNSGRLPDTGFRCIGLPGDRRPPRAVATGQSDGGRRLRV